MLIMQISSFVCLSPMRTCRPLADWRSSVIVTSSLERTELLGHADKDVYSTEKLHPMIIVLVVGLTCGGHKCTTLVHSTLL